VILAENNIPVGIVLFKKVFNKICSILLKVLSRFYVLADFIRKLIFPIQYKEIVLLKL